jgi:hypothetical protein
MLAGRADSLGILLYIRAAKYEVVEKTSVKGLDEKTYRSYNYKWVPRDPESGKKLSAKAMGSEQPDRNRRVTIRKGIERNLPKTGTYKN